LLHVCHWAYIYDMTVEVKSERISLRVTAEQKSVIESAARAQGRSVTDLAVHATIEHAQGVLADRAFFAVPDDQWDSFVASLTAPVSQQEALAATLRAIPTLPARD
jgi:uncharacterized protein (DUF1778 family)